MTTHNLTTEQDPSNESFNTLQEAIARAITRAASDGSRYFDIVSTTSKRWRISFPETLDTAVGTGET